MGYSCENCGRIDPRQTRIEVREETYSVKGKPITLPATVRVCESCCEAVYDRELDSRNIDNAYDLYRAQFGEL